MLLFPGFKTIKFVPRIELSFKTRILRIKVNLTAILAKLGFLH